MTRRPLLPLALAALAACATAPAADPAPAPAAALPDSVPMRQQPPTPGPLRPYRLPPVEQFTLPNGLRVVAVRQTGMPLVTGRVIVDAGAVREPAAKAGLAVLTGSLLAEGTRQLTGPELAARMEQLGAQFQTGGGSNTGFVTVTALKSAFPEAMRLAAATVVEPGLRPADFERIRSQAVAGFLQGRATVEGLAGETFARAVYAPGAPYGRPAGGTEATLKGLTRADVAAWHRERYAPGSTTLLLVGDLDAAEARRLAEDAFGGWRKTAPRAPSPTSALRPVTGTRVILVDRPGSVQSAIRVGQGAIGAEDPDFFRMTALNHVLGGGFNARINQNLRERHGWTYGAFSNFAALQGVGTVAISSSVRTNATDSALVESVQEFRRLARETVPASEMSGALGNLVGSFPASVQTVQGLAQRMQTAIVYGLPLDYYATYRERLAAVTPEEAAELARRLLAPDALTIVVAGDLAAIEAPIRALNLGAVEVWSPEGERVR
ncbi:MAG TPA: pitrilysin family protein [Longimicrobiaceae bacterium]|nr:pitrilysin family protein [Longimicrobiaceae bacterium]